MTEPLVQPPAETHGRTPQHVWDYWRITWEGRRILLGVLGGTLAIAIVGTFFMPTRYRAETLVEISVRPPAVLGTALESSMLRSSFLEQDRELKTEFVRIKTRDLLGRAIETHGLKEAVPTLGAVRDPILVLQRCIDVDRIEQTNVARISVSWNDPDQAAVISNAVSESYVDADLIDRATRLRNRVKNLIGAIEEKSAARRDVVEQELAVLKSDAAIETKMTLSTLKENGRLQKLWEDQKAADREVQSLNQTFGSAYAPLREKVAVRDEIRRQVDDVLDAAMGDVESELRALHGDPDAVKPSTTLITSRAREANEKLEQQLQDSLKESQVLAAVVDPKAKIMERARRPLKPYAPRWGLNLSLAVVVGLGLGGGLVFFRDYLDVSVKTLDDVEKGLGLSLLCVVPRYEGGDLTPEARESYQTLRTGLLFASAGRRDRVLLISSGAPQDGKTAVAINLARAIVASGESVALVDGDLRRASLSRLLGVGRGKGLSNYLADASIRSWRDVAEQVEPKLTLLPTGPVPPNPVDLLGLTRFRELLSELKSTHDWVLIDSPPVGSVSDSVVLASLVEMVLVVMRHDRTDREVVRRALLRLRGVGANVIGAVLNDVDMTRSYNRDYYYGRFYYGHYYGEEGGAATDAPKQRARAGARGGRG